MSDIRYSKSYAAALRLRRETAERARRASLSLADAIEEARYSVQVEDGDLVQVWDDFEARTTKLVPLVEYADTIYRS